MYITKLNVILFDSYLTGWPKLIKERCFLLKERNKKYTEILGNLFHFEERELFNGSLRQSLSLKRCCFGQKKYISSKFLSCWPGSGLNKMCCFFRKGSRLSSLCVSFRWQVTDQFPVYDWFSRNTFFKTVKSSKFMIVSMLQEKVRKKKSF